MILLERPRVCFVSSRLMHGVLRRQQTITSGKECYDYLVVGNKAEREAGG